jgi:L-iditol 2-dehydrogenase
VKAIVINGPHSTSIKNVPVRDLTSGEARVRVIAAGVCGTDVEIVSGTMKYFVNGMASYPIIPGHEWVGDVVETGPGVNTVSVGDRVVGECSIGCMFCQECRTGNYHRCGVRTETGIMRRDGCFAEFLNFPAPYLHKISKDVSIEDACLVEPVAVAFNGIRLGGVSPGDFVAVFGDGPIGLLLVQLAWLFGAGDVALIGASPERMEFARKVDPSLIVDARKGEINSALLKHAGVLPTVVMEATGNPAAVAAAIQASAPGGRVILQGLCGGQTDTGLDLDQIVVGDVAIRGALGSPGVWPRVIRLIESGQLKPSTVISDILTFTDFDKAISMVRDRRGIKIVLRPGDQL